MNRRIGRCLALAAATALTVSLATACSSSGGGGGKYGTLEGDALKIAFRPDDKPVSFVDNGKPAGLLVDLVTDLSRQLGLKPQFVSTDFNSILPGVQNHRFDTAAFGTLVTDDRRKVTNFTSATGYGTAKLVTRKSAALATVQDAAGKTVAITRGSALIPLLQKTVPTVKIREFPNIAASANALEAKQVDGLFTGPATVLTLLSQHDDFTASQEITTGMTALPVAKDKAKLLTALNGALTKAMTDGTYTTLFGKWNPPGELIPAKLLTDYPGLQQRSGASTGS